MGKKIVKLLPSEKEVMRLVEHGADIYDYSSARVLREVEKRHPKFISGDVTTHFLEEMGRIEEKEAIGGRL